MINQSAIKKFLKRTLENYDWLKKTGHEKLIRELDGMLTPQHIVRMWIHQKVCFLLLTMIKRFMLHIDMGGGKTSICLMLLVHRKNKGETPKAIAFVPYITSVKTWIDEVEKHTPELTCVPLIGTSAENLRVLENTPGDIFVVCYQSAVAMFTETLPTKRKGKKKWVLDLKLLRRVTTGFDTMICDEIHRCKSVTSLTYRMCRAISAKVEYSVGLTGTPFGKDISDLWPQFYLIDFGETLGPTLGFFRSVFFDEKINFWGGYEHKFCKEMMPQLTTIIKNRSIRYSIDEMHDLPARKYIKIPLPQPKDSEAYIKVAREGLKAGQKAMGAERYRLVESNYLQLRQLASGFMTLRGEDKSAIQVAFSDNPKLDAMQELIEGMPHDAKMIVFHHFVYTNQLISDRLKAMKIKHARIWSGQRKPLDELGRFAKDPSCKILVINSKSGSSSLNLQNANYVVFFEEPDNPIDRQQAERRAWRPGQLKKVFFYSLIVEKTADAGLHGSNLQGKSLLKQLLDGKGI